MQFNMEKDFRDNENDIVIASKKSKIQWGDKLLIISINVQIPSLKFTVKDGKKKYETKDIKKAVEKFNLR